MVYAQQQAALSAARATKIQAVWRGNMARRNTAALRVLQAQRRQYNAAAVLIQASLTYLLLCHQCCQLRNMMPTDTMASCLSSIQGYIVGRSMLMRSMLQSVSCALSWHLAHYSRPAKDPPKNAGSPVVQHKHELAAPYCPEQ